MKRVLSWTGGVILSLVVLGATAHASTSTAAHERGECIVCNLHDCLYSMLFS